ncbi:hydrolase [Bacillus cereus group sp. RP32]|uniref:hydrolase n=1 Tax=Bacillus cereus group sp. RP32 TaxID=3040258 RepID=UPI003396414A
MASGLNGRVAALGLIPIDKKAYIKYFKPNEKAYKKSGIDINRFKYYKLHEQEPMFYSIEYLMQTPIKDLLERDKENQTRWIKTNE